MVEAQERGAEGVGSEALLSVRLLASFLPVCRRELEGAGLAIAVLEEFPRIAGGTKGAHSTQKGPVKQKLNRPQVRGFTERALRDSNSRPSDP